MTLLAALAALLFALVVVDLIEDHARRARLQNLLDRWRWPAKGDPSCPRK